MSDAEPTLILKIWVPSYQTIKKVKGILVGKELSIIPSLNELLGLQHWERDKRKKGIQLAMLSALSPSGFGYSMKTTYAQNMQSIFCDTAVRFLAMRQASAKSRRVSASRKKAKTNIPK